MTVNGFLGIEIYPVHVGRFLLFISALVTLAINVPRWTVLIAAPLVALGAIGWLYEASIVVPAARQLLKRATDEQRLSTPCSED